MNKERGAILPLFAIIIVVIVGIVALLVDLSRGSYTVDTIQQAVDAASLSAVRQLNGKQNGWDNSVSAAMLTLQTNPISGVPAKALEGMVLTANSDLGKKTLGIQNGLQVTIARGVYWHDETLNNGAGGRHFVSLEEGAKSGKGPWLHQDFSPQIFANAVKVDVTIEKLETSSFSKISGTGSLNNLSKSSVAISDNQLDLPVYPAAIPYCQLMLNSNENELNNHLLNSYDPSKAITRELYFTELEGFVTGSNDKDIEKLPTATQERREGLRRYLSHIYLPTYNITGKNLCSDARSGTAVSCKKVPIRGLLGVYGDAPGPSDSSDLKEFLSQAQSGLSKVQLGQHFKPLKSWSADTIDVSKAMQDFLDSGNETIGSLYVNTTSGLNHAKLNFPAVRHQQTASGAVDFMQRPAVYAGSPKVDFFSSNRINWPLKIGDTEYRYGLLLGLNRSPGQIAPINTVTSAPFINPLCNSAEENLDQTNYKVKQFSVMVIAPASEEDTYGVEQVSYCDFEHQFKGEVQGARVPWWKNEPRVVGVVPIDFIGFNFEDLDTRFVNNTPEYQDVHDHTIVIKDDNPGLLELGANSKPQVEHFEDEYNNCEANMSSNPDACKTLEVSDEIVLPDEISMCFDDSILLGFKNGLEGVNGKAEACDSKKNQCHEIDSEENPTGYAQCQNQYNACINGLNRDFKNLTNLNQVFNLPAIPDRHCLPLPTETAHDFNSSSNFEQPLQPLKAGRGCGGVRARVSASSSSDPLLLNTGKSWSQMTPMLVEDGS